MGSGGGAAWVGGLSKKAKAAIKARKAEAERRRAAEARRREREREARAKDRADHERRKEQGLPRPRETWQSAWVRQQDANGERWCRHCAKKLFDDRARAEHVIRIARSEPPPDGRVPVRAYPCPLGDDLPVPVDDRPHHLTSKTSGRRRRRRGGAATLTA